jgi:prevent-host-death family protein
VVPGGSGRPGAEAGLLRPWGCGQVGGDAGRAAAARQQGGGSDAGQRGARAAPQVRGHHGARLDNKKGGFRVRMRIVGAPAGEGAAGEPSCRPAAPRLDLTKIRWKSAMETVNIYDAKTRLSQLVDKAASGEDVVVSRNGKPLVRITRLDATRRRIKFGLLKGKVTIPEDFDAPLPDDALASFEGR